MARKLVHEIPKAAKLTAKAAFTHFEDMSSSATTHSGLANQAMIPKKMPMKPLIRS